MQITLTKKKWGHGMKHKIVTYQCPYCKHTQCIDFYTCPACGTNVLNGGQTRNKDFIYHTNNTNNG